MALIPCPDCGTEVSDAAAACPKCSRPIAAQAAAAAVLVRPMKSPGVAAVLSFFFSGLGQIYNGRIGKGLGFMVLQFVNAGLMFVIIGFVTFPLTWIWGMVDAYQDAEAINRGDAVPGGSPAAVLVAVVGWVSCLWSFWRCPHPPSTPPTSAWPRTPRRRPSFTRPRRQWRRSTDRAA
jgi:TM2 domain-containing membrane protein YozV